MRSLVALPALFFALAVSAQQPLTKAPPPVPEVQFQPAPLPSSCPVRFSVDRTSGLVMRSVTDGMKSGTGPGIQLRFRAPDAARLVKATVVLHGTTSFGWLLPVAGKTNDLAKEQIEIQRTPGASTLTRRELWAKKMTAITFVELKELEFADGTTWHEPSPLACTMSPSLFVLVGTR